MPNSLSKWLTISLFIGPCFLFAQDKVPLIEVLDSLKSKFGVEFSYADDVVGQKVVDAPDFNNEIKVIFEILTDQTELQFEILQFPYVVIKPDAARAILSFCGFVFNSESQQPIENVLISYGGKIDLTDSTGFFAIDPLKSRENIVLQRIGFQNLRIDPRLVGADTCTKFSMIPASNTLSEVVITDFITRGVDRTNNGMFRMEMDQLQVLPGLPETDILYNVQNLPGVQSLTESISDINIRGGTHDQNLFLWNGIRVFQTGHFFGLISAFNPNFTPNVSLLKHGTSSKYGNAVSGTLLINSKYDLSHNISGHFGSNMLFSDGLVEVPMGPKMSVTLGGRHSVAEMWTSPTYKKYFKRAFAHTDILSSDLGVSKTVQDFSFHDLNAVFKYKPSSRERLQVSLIRIGNQIENKETEIDSINETRISTLKQQSLALGLSHQKLWTANLRSRTQIYFSDYQLTSVNFDLPKDLRLRQGNQVRDLGSRLELGFILHPRLDMLVGYQFNETSIEDLETTDNPQFERFTKKVNRTHVLYGEAVLGTFSNETQLRFGIRGNYYELADEVVIEPRISLHHRLTKMININLSAERKSQAMSQVIDLEDDFLGVEKRRWVLSEGSEIPVITSNQFSTGVSFHDRSNLISLEGYYKKVDGILTSGQRFQNQFQTIREEGDYQVYGMELLVSKKIDPVNLWWSYNIGRNRYHFKDLDPSNFPNNLDIRHYVYTGQTLKLKKLEFSSGFTWRSGRPITLPETDNPIVNGEINYDIPNEHHLPSYFRWDVSMRGKIFDRKSWSGDVGFSVWNLTNRKNLFNKYYIIIDEEMQEIKQKALGITPNIMLRVRFR